MKSFPGIKKKSPYDVGEIVNPFGIRGTVKVRRLKHPRSGFEAYVAIESQGDATLIAPRARAVAKLVKEGISNASTLSSAALAKLDEGFADAYAKSRNDETASKAWYEALAVSLVAGWSGEEFAVLPENGRFTSETVAAAFFPSGCKAEDATIVPNFWKADDDGNDVRPLYEGDDLHGKAIEIRDRLRKKEEQAILAAGKPSPDERKEIKRGIEEELDRELAAVNIKRHDFGGVAFREAKARMIVSKAQELQGAYEDFLSLR